MMLVISRQKDESIVINGDITVVVVEIRADTVRLGIEAPKEASVHRREVYDAIRRNCAQESASEIQSEAVRTLPATVAMRKRVNGYFENLRLTLGSSPRRAATLRRIPQYWRAIVAWPLLFFAFVLAFLIFAVYLLVIVLPTYLVYRVRHWYLNRRTAHQSESDENLDRTPPATTFIDVAEAPLVMAIRKHPVAEPVLETVAPASQQRRRTKPRAQEKSEPSRPLTASRKKAVAEDKDPKSASSTRSRPKSSAKRTTKRSSSPRKRPNKPR